MSDSTPTVKREPPSASFSSDLFGEEAYNLLDRIATLLSLDLERPRVMAAITHLLDSSFKRALATKEAENAALRDALQALKDIVDGKRHDADKIAAIINGALRLPPNIGHEPRGGS